jgi:uncharacterized protein
MSVRVILHAPTVGALARARSNARNLLRADPTAEIRKAQPRRSVSLMATATSIWCCAKTACALKTWSLRRESPLCPR